MNRTAAVCVAALAAGLVLSACGGSPAASLASGQSPASGQAPASGQGLASGQGPASGQGSAAGQPPAPASAASGQPPASGQSPAGGLTKVGKYGGYNGGGPYSTSKGSSSAATATALDESVRKWGLATGAVPFASMPAVDLDCQPVGANDEPPPPSFVQWTCNTTQVTVVIAITGAHSWKIVSLSAD